MKYIPLITDIASVVTKSLCGTTVIFFINYAGYPGSFPEYNFSDVIDTEGFSDAE